jgi:hypothetical protein
MGWLCSKCNDHYFAKVTDGKAIIKVCAFHFHELTRQGWRQVFPKRSR